MASGVVSITELTPSLGRNEPENVIASTNVKLIVMLVAAGLKNGPFVAGSGSVKSGVTPPARDEKPGVANSSVRPFVSGGNDKLFGTVNTFSTPSLVALSV